MPVLVNWYGAVPDYPKPMLVHWSHFLWSISILSAVNLWLLAHAVKVDYVGSHTFRLRLFLMEYLHWIYDWSHPHSLKYLCCNFSWLVEVQIFLMVSGMSSQRGSQNLLVYSLLLIARRWCFKRGFPNLGGQRWKAYSCCFLV